MDTKRVLLKTGAENLAIFQTHTEAELVRLVLFREYDTTVEEIQPGSILVGHAIDLVAEGTVMLDKVLELTSLKDNNYTH